MTYKAHEFERDTMNPTGRIETYLASDLAEAVQHLLYSKRLRDGRAKVGPSGRTVYSGSHCYAVVESACPEVAYA